MFAASWRCTSTLAAMASCTNGEWCDMEFWDVGDIGEAGRIGVCCQLALHLHLGRHGLLHVLEMRQNGGCRGTKLDCRASPGHMHGRLGFPHMQELAGTIREAWGSRADLCLQPSVFVCLTQGLLPL